MNKSKKAIRKFNGVTFTLYKSGSKQEVDAYIKKYGIPKTAKYRRIKVGNENRLYISFKKS